MAPLLAYNAFSIHVGDESDATAGASGTWAGNIHVNRGFSLGVLTLLTLDDHVRGGPQARIERRLRGRRATRVSAAGSLRRTFHSVAGGGLRVDEPDVGKCGR